MSYTCGPHRTLPIPETEETKNVTPDLDQTEAIAYTDSSEQEPAGAQLLGVIILEFGILFHSVRTIYYVADGSSSSA